MKFKLGEIVRAWWIASNPTPQQSELAKKRLAICNGCDSMVDSIVYTKICNECGCPIGKKIFTDVMGSCDLKKWNKVEGL
jgi:hypothetical protein